MTITWSFKASLQVRTPRPRLNPLFLVILKTLMILVTLKTLMILVILVILKTLVILMISVISVISVILKTLVISVILTDFSNFYNPALCASQYQLATCYISPS